MCRYLFQSINSARYSTIKRLPIQPVLIFSGSHTSALSFEQIEQQQTKKSIEFAADVCIDQVTLARVVLSLG
jgi:hypothetical protein